MLARLIGLFKPPACESLDRTQKARFLHITLLVVTGACIVTGLLNAGVRPDVAIFLLLVGGASLVCIPLNKLGYYTPVALVITFLVLGVITFSLMGVGLGDAGVIAYPIFIIFASYLLNKKAAFMAVLLSLASAFLVYYLDKTGYIAPARYSDENRLIVVCVLLLSTGLLLWVIIDNWGQIVQDLKDTYDMTLSGWGKALEYRDQETQGHSTRVVEMTLALAERLGMPEAKMEHIRRGAQLHDIGKMAIPDAVLLKKGSFTDEERDIIKKHPAYAKNLLEGIPYLKPAMDIPYCHHERWDGAGYPEGLSGTDIPIAARIFSVVDVWDALTSKRPYHEPWPVEKARQHIQDQSGKMFDPRVVEMFLEFLDKSRG